MALLGCARAYTVDGELRQEYNPARRTVNLFKRLFGQRAFGFFLFFLLRSHIDLLRIRLLDANLTEDDR
jgi:hypothetical protein